MAKDLEEIKQRLRQFAEARDWDQFHSPKNLSMAIGIAVILSRFYGKK